MLWHIKERGINLALQLLFNGALALFFIYCFFYVGTIVPENAPGTMSAAQWPQMLLALLVIFLVVNMVNIVKKTPKEERNLSTVTSLNFKGLYKNRLFIGIVLLLVYALILDYLGFVVSTFLFSVAYSYLLGEKRIPRLLLYSFIITVILYVLFQMGLDIMLPRGIGVFRNFALMLESI